MQKKIFFGLFLSVGLLASCGGQSSWWNERDSNYAISSNENVLRDNDVAYLNEPVQQVVYHESQGTYNKRVPPLNSLLVCRDKQCAPADLSMSREYIYNALAHLTDNNLDSTALLCEANAQAHVCVNPYITVPARIGVTPAYVYFDGVEIVDATALKGETALSLILGYRLTYNGQTPSVCRPDKAMLYVKENNEIVLNGNGFKCDMTSVGTTTVRVMFTVDYIDLDYGYLGGYYSIGFSGPAMGGGNGYGMIRLSKDAHPLKPVLKSKSPAAHMGAMNFNPKDRANQLMENVAFGSMPQSNEPAIAENGLPIVNVQTGGTLAKDNAQKTSFESAPVVEQNVESNQMVPQTDNTGDIGSFRDESALVEPTVIVPQQALPEVVNAGSAAQPSSDVFEAEDGSTYETMSVENNGSQYEEVYVEDLDDYIK